MSSCSHVRDLGAFQEHPGASGSIPGAYWSTPGAPCDVRVAPV